MIDRKLIEKIRVGDSITDAELDEAVIFYRGASNHLDALGREFHIAWKEVYFTLKRLEGYQKARQERKNGER